jgi:3-oxoacyl-[acyl-carrier-protein] synthase II
MGRRVVITGLGVIAPGGIGIETFWNEVKNGHSAVNIVQQFESGGLPTRIAAEVIGFNPWEFVNRRWLNRVDRTAQFAMGAARMAYDDARLNLKPATAIRTGIFEGTALGGMNENLLQHKQYLADSHRRINPLSLIKGMTGSASGSIALEFHLHGPSITFSNGCVSSSWAIGYGFEKIQHGELDLAFVGGAEAPVSKEIFTLFSTAHLMSTCNESPSSAFKPFDAKRDGFVVGEGGAMLILEELHHALARGAHIYAEIVGFGGTTDAYHATAPDPEGEMIAGAMRAALTSAGIQPEEVSYLNAHGTATELNDVTETRAIRKTFGERANRLPVSSSKSITGHLLGACGAMELVIASLAIEHQWIPPTVNLHTMDPRCDLDYVPVQGRPAKLDIVMSNNYSFGGRNSAIILKRFLT